MQIFLHTYENECKNFTKTIGNTGLCRKNLGYDAECRLNNTNVTTSNNIYIYHFTALVEECKANSITVLDALLSF